MRRVVRFAAQRRSFATTPSINLMYFDIVGRAQPLRLLLADSGLPFEQQLMSKETWPAAKPQTPLGSIPVLRWGGVPVAQTLAIAGFLGEKLGLLGESDEERATATGLATCCYTELFGPLNNCMWAPVRMKGVPLAAVVNAYGNKVDDLSEYIVRLMHPPEQGPFVLGVRPCVADFFLAEWARRHRECLGDSLPLPPRLGELEAAVMARPGVASYLESGQGEMLRLGGGPVDKAYSRASWPGQLRWTNSPAEEEVREFMASYAHGAADHDANLGKGAG